MMTPNNQQEWDALVAPFAPASGAFLQSWGWGEFQMHHGRDVKRIAVVNEGKVMIAQAVKLAAPLGISYWLVPKGPLGTLTGEDMRKILVEALSVGVDYIRTESIAKLPGTMTAKEMHPQTTRLLDLSVGYENVFNDFNPKARYNMRLGRKKGVECAFVGLERFDDFVDLMKQTAERDAFNIHETEYYREMLTVLGSNVSCHAQLALASRDGVPLATVIVVDAFGMRTYLHGASGNTLRELKAPQVLQDFVIRDACEKGLLIYDFWGIAPPGSTEKHPWWGITRFKEGFGGYVYATAGTFDIPVNVGKYGLYRAAKMVRGWVGG